ncbi:MAG: hypothetical protein QM689_08285 [Oscillospiraceae bacterium]
MKKLISAVTAGILLMCATSATAFAVAPDPAEGLKPTADYTMDTLFSTIPPAYGDEWYIFALARSGMDGAEDVCDTYYAAAEADFIAKNGIYTDGTGTESLAEYVRVGLVLTAMGKDITDFGGYNLLEKFTSLDFSAYTASSTSTLSYALILTGEYADLIDTSAALEQDIIDEIMTRYLDNTGFTYMLGDFAAVDADTTSQAMQGLLPYADTSTAIADAITNSYAYLKAQQNTQDGAILSWGSSNPSSTAQVMIIASQMGADTYADFTLESGFDLLSGLLQFRLDDGGFYEPYYGAEAGADYFSTAQGLLGLTAFYRMESDKTPLFDFSDVVFESDDSTPDTSDNTTSEPDPETSSEPTTESSTESTSPIDSDTSDTSGDSTVDSDDASASDTSAPVTGSTSPLPFVLISAALVLAAARITLTKRAD